jgi:hypothetical protein
MGTVRSSILERENVPSMPLVRFNAGPGRSGIRTLPHQKHGSGCATPAPELAKAPFSALSKFWNGRRESTCKPVRSNPSSRHDLGQIGGCGKKLVYTSADNKQSVRLTLCADILRGFRFGAWITNCLLSMTYAVLLVRCKACWASEFAMCLLFH